MSITDFQAVIGLEVHIELNTKTKMFCSCKTDFGAAPNTLCCPICLGHPGALPKLNGIALKKAVTAGLALNCTISDISYHDRKNYFYPDLPKGYQISQNEYPLCKNGKLTIDTCNGEKDIRINRIHIEEDAGKLIHNDKTLIDCNRCGVPLIEIVSEPDISSAEQAVAYLKKLQSIIIFTGISECRMNEGQFRCDVNVSLQKKGVNELGTRTEIKNLNSFAFVAKAIECEIKRQSKLLTEGNPVLRQTMKYDADKNVTVPMRDKESSADYRFFPEPDLPPIVVSAELIESISKAMPMLPDQRKKIYVEKYALTPYDASVICSMPHYAEYFEKGADMTAYPKTFANLMISELPRIFENNLPKIDCRHLAELCEMLGNGSISSSVGKKALVAVAESDISPRKYVEQNDLYQISDYNTIFQAAKNTIEQNPKLKDDYINGKTAASKAIIGACMKNTGGKLNAVMLNNIVSYLLNSYKSKE